MMTIWRRNANAERNKENNKTWNMRDNSSNIEEVTEEQDKTITAEAVEIITIKMITETTIRTEVGTMTREMIEGNSISSIEEVCNKIRDLISMAVIGSSNMMIEIEITIVTMKRIKVESIKLEAVNTNSNKTTIKEIEIVNIIISNIRMIVTRIDSTMIIAEINNIQKIKHIIIKIGSMIIEDTDSNIMIMSIEKNLIFIKEMLVNNKMIEKTIVE